MCSTHLLVGDVVRHIVKRDDNELTAIVDKTERYVADRQSPTLDGLLEVLDASRSLERDANDAATVAEQLGDAGHLLGVDGLHQSLHHLQVGKLYCTQRLEVACELAVLAFDH